MSIQLDAEFQYLLEKKWSISSGYAQRLDLGFLHRVVMVIHLGRLLVKGEQVDHITRNPLDNRIENLRLATQSENHCNRGKFKNNTSGFKGVSWHKYTQKWEAKIMLDGTRKYLGYFDTPEKAALAYNAAARELHGEFAYQNEVE